MADVVPFSRSGRDRHRELARKYRDLPRRAVIDWSSETTERFFKDIRQMGLGGEELRDLLDSVDPTSLLYHHYITWDRLT